jgi:hypothetical protein
MLVQWLTITLTYHYARNFSLPESGSEEGEGKVYTKPVTVKLREHV